MRFRKAMILLLAGTFVLPGNPVYGSAGCLELHQAPYDYNDVSCSSGAVVFSEEDTHVIMLCGGKKIEPQKAHMSFQVTETVPSFIRGVLFSVPEREEDRIKEKISVTVKEKFDVYFPFNSWSLTHDQMEFLKRKLSGIREKFEREKIRISEINIVGCACHIGSKNYNKKLSERRAKAVSEVVREVFGEGVVINAEGVGEVRESQVTCLNRKVTVIIKGEIQDAERGT